MWTCRLICCDVLNVIEDFTSTAFIIHDSCSHPVISSMSLFVICFQLQHFMTCCYYQQNSGALHTSLTASLMWKTRLVLALAVIWDTMQLVPCIGGARSYTTLQWGCWLAACSHWAHYVQCDVIHKTGSMWHIATLPEEDWAAAIENMHKEFTELRTLQFIMGC